MINSTNTVTIDGLVIDHEEILNTLKVGETDKFTRWVARPLALLAAVAVAVAILFAGVFMMLLSLALVPLLAVLIWAVRIKLQRDITNADPVVNTQE